MKANAMIISAATPQTTDMAMMAPFDSGFCGVEG
jgi:hypothetical protein